jgi:hypothetical protein
VLFRDKDGKLWGVGKDGMTPIKPPPVTVDLNAAPRPVMTFPDPPERRRCWPLTHDWFTTTASWDTTTRVVKTRACLRCHKSRTWVEVL